MDNRQRSGAAAGFTDSRNYGVTENWLRFATPDNKTTSQRDNESCGSTCSLVVC